MLKLYFNLRGRGRNEREGEGIETLKQAEIETLRNSLNISNIENEIAAIS